MSEYTVPTDYLKYRGVIYEIITFITVAILWCCMVAVPIAISSGFEKLTYESRMQTEVLIVIGAELKMLNANGQKAMQGAGIVPAEKMEVGE